MSNFKKISLLVILIILFFVNTCFAIDENQLSNNTTDYTTNTQNIVLDADNVNTDTSYTSTVQTQEEEHPSTTVSSVSSYSNSSTISNILNIALIVIGILLILLAIAILIRLH